MRVTNQSVNPVLFSRRFRLLRIGEVENMTIDLTSKDWCKNTRWVFVRLPEFLRAAIPRHMMIRSSFIKCPAAMMTRICAATIPRHMVIYPLFINYCGAAGITIVSVPGLHPGLPMFSPDGAGDVYTDRFGCSN